MLKQTQRIERLDQLIRLGATGNARECAEKLDISERQFYNTIDLMKEMGAPIYFDNSIRSYCYEYLVVWNHGFTKV
ncbi:hypothetical protein [Roseivirga misakiensis]|uniref:Helix-turn-helix type 11 domain-containing protein n=1 Tax=Roseivirga misakiensis TaxID=1563681 RepID=A0A1E5SK99_9BACT|nr:hypothetical protein [Roseivirga misakiensis]OEJ99533.1 hypothetical protein BFP71_08110 [Roseivirga misakiensis]